MENRPSQHRRGRTNHSSSSSSSSSSSRYQRSHEFQSINPTKSAKYSSPNNNNNNHIKKEQNNKSTFSRSTRNRDGSDVEEEEKDGLGLPNTTLVGTCPFMCPVEERAQRERLQDLSVFERLDGNPGKTSSSLAVKKFCRTISTKHVQASDVRPLPVLEDTLNYLFNFLDSRENSFEVVHEFIFDRTRSIRQDLSMQNVIGDQPICLYERMVKFHVISNLKLRRFMGSPNISPMHYLNMEQLTKALASLYNLYAANRSTQSIYENEAEFHSFYVLLHLGSDSQPMGESLSLWFRHVPYPIIKSKEMCFARRVLRYFRLGNYKRFICTTEAEASYLQYCIIEPYISEVRALAMSCVNYGGYKLHPYPLADLSKLLLMKESDVESFCSDCGLETSTDEVGKKFLPTKQTSFCDPKRGLQNFYLLVSERFERLAVETGSGWVKIVL